MFPYLYYSAIVYFGFNIVKPIFTPLTYYIYKLAFNNTRVQTLQKFDLKNFANKKYNVYIFEKHFNFLKLDLVSEESNSEEVLDLNDFEHVEYPTKNVTKNIKINDFYCLVTFKNQVDINKNLIDYLIIKCDQHLLFKQVVFSKFFELSGMTKQQFDIIYIKYPHLVLNLTNGELHWTN